MYYILLYIYLTILWLCFLAALTITFRSNTPSYIKWFSPTLISIIIVTIVAHRIAVKTQNNHAIYNLFSVYTTVFYILIMRVIIQNKKMKRVISVCCLIYPFIALTNIFYFQGMDSFHTYTNSIGSTLIVGSCAYYLQEVFFVDEPVPNLTKRPDFWICLGLFFFYGVTFVSFAGIHIISASSLSFINVMSCIMMLSNYGLYIFFLIAFFCCMRYPGKVDCMRHVKTQLFE